MLPAGDSTRTLSRALGELAELEYRLGDWPAACMSAVESLRAAKLAGLDEETMGHSRPSGIGGGELGQGGRLSQARSGGDRAEPRARQRGG
jgi:hypothetical protein